MEKKRLGVALCGSYCTYEKLFAALEPLAERYELIPIMSENAAETDTRFGTAAGHIRRLMELTGRRVVTTVAEAERKVVETQTKASADVLKQEVAAYGGDADYVRAKLYEKAAPRVRDVVTGDSPGEIFGLPIRGARPSNVGGGAKPKPTSVQQQGK